MCTVWGASEEAINSVKGLMPYDKLIDILDQLPAGTWVQPSMWGEPTLIPDFVTVLEQMKARYLKVAFNTNGLTLTDDMINCMVANEVESVSFSLDAVTRETLARIRGVTKIEKIEAAAFRVMGARGSRRYPRVGVSFTIQDGNRHELEAFISRWVGVVDVVRTSYMHNGDTFVDAVVPKKRIPCPALYRTLPIHHDGQATVCCLDGFKHTNMGNVFEAGVEGVWDAGMHSMRFLHEIGKWDTIPACAKCNGWAQDLYEERTEGNIFIRQSPIYAYYNRIDRMDNWVL